MLHVQEIMQNSSYILIRGLYSSLNVCMRSFSRRHRYTSQVYRLLSLHPHSLGLCKGLSSLLKPSNHLNTVIFIFLMIPQLFVINYRFLSAIIKNSKRILSLCKFLSHPVKPHFAVFFLQKGSQKLSLLLYLSEVTLEI